MAALAACHPKTTSDATPTIAVVKTPSATPAAAATLTVSTSGDPVADIRVSTIFFLGTSAAVEEVVSRSTAAADRVAKKLGADPGGEPAAIRGFLLRRISLNLLEKRVARLNGQTFPMSKDDLDRTVVDFEAWRAEAYVSSGVFPKRYFGYLDGKWDTGPYENRLKKTVHGASGVANDFLEKKSSKLRVTDAEIATTFLAEGGAILLREDQKDVDNIHPVFGVGLDDVGSGFAAYQPLVDALDLKFGSGLHEVVKHDGGNFKGATFSRNFTFEEALLGTTVMWVFEKERAEKKLRDARKEELSDKSADDQFVIGSLMYNAGLLFEPDTVARIREFSSGPYLADLSNKTQKTKGGLPVASPKDALSDLLTRGDYPEQETSWSGVYHVLQRWGAYHALRTLTADFDDAGSFVSEK